MTTKDEEKRPNGRRNSIRPVIDRAPIQDAPGTVRKNKYRMTLEIDYDVDTGAYTFNGCHVDGEDGNRRISRSGSRDGTTEYIADPLDMAQAMTESLRHLTREAKSRHKKAHPGEA
jgi:hypothetical protein